MLRQAHQCRRQSVLAGRKELEIANEEIQRQSDNPAALPCVKTAQIPDNSPRNGLRTAKERLERCGPLSGRVKVVDKK